MLLPLLLGLSWIAVSVPSPAMRGPVLAEDAHHEVDIPSLSTLAAPDSIEGLRRAIAAVLEREGVPGVGIAVVDRDGVVWSGGVGVADRETQAPVTADTVFRVASITKSIVGLGVARLVGQGKLSLDTPLSRTLPDIHIDNPWEDTTPVTLAHALEHTAGFDDMRFNEWFAADESMAPAQALAINPRSRSVRWRPGSRASYSNVGYSVAGHAIEQATGQPFDHWLRAEVLTPLRMEQVAFRRTDQRRQMLATGYLGPDRAARFSPIAHRAAGAMLASPAEMGRLVHFLLRRGQGYPTIVTPEMLDRVERSATSSLPTTDDDYGLGNYGDVAHPERGRGHDGGLPGFLSAYRYFPRLGVGYVMLLNSTHSARAYGRIRSLLFAYVARGKTLLPPPFAEPEADRGGAAGYYRYDSPRNALFGFLDRAMVGWTVTPSADGVDLEPLLGSPVALVATGDGGYRHPMQSGTSVRLARDEQGRRVLVAGFVHAVPASGWLARLRIWLLGLAVVLLQVAPVFALLWAVLRVARRRDFRGAGLWLWPAAAGLAFGAMPLLLGEASARDALGEVDPTTVGLCVATIVFALASAFGLVAAVRATLARDRIAWWVRAIPSLTITLAVGLTLWLGAHGIIGLRTWAW